MVRWETLVSSLDEAAPCDAAPIKILVLDLWAAEAAAASLDPAHPSVPA
jgi:hypothetical protein